MSLRDRFSERLLLRCAPERLYQLAETIGASKTMPSTLGLLALVVDAAPYDIKDMSEGLLASND